MRPKQSCQVWLEIDSVRRGPSPGLLPDEAAYGIWRRERF